MTSYGYTPGYASLFESDLQNMKKIIIDPTGNYKFDTTAESNAGHYAMIEFIAQSAKKVSEDGALLVYITAHGADSGQIEPADQQYATFGFPEVLKGIQKGRKDLPPFKRLFIVISACYSGSWLDTIRANASYKEFVALTSASPWELSNIGEATAAMKVAFDQAKAKPNTTMRSFLDASRRQNPHIQFKAEPATIWDEPLINSGSATPETKDSQDSGVYARVMDATSLGQMRLQLSIPSDMTEPSPCLKTNSSVGCVQTDLAIPLVKSLKQPFKERLLFETQSDVSHLSQTAKNVFNIRVVSGDKNVRNIKFAAISQSI